MGAETRTNHSGGRLSRYSKAKGGVNADRSDAEQHGDTNCDSGFETAAVPKLLLLLPIHPTNPTMATATATSTALVHPMDPVGAVPTVTPFLLLATSSVEYELDERKKLVSSDRMCPLVSPERPSFQGSYAQQRWPTSRQYAATYHSAP